MPSTTPERAARWPGGDAEASEVLDQGGWTIGQDWNFRHPENRKPTEREADAMIYLQEEWDFGFLVPADYPDAKAPGPQPATIRDDDGGFDIF